MSNLSCSVFAFPPFSHLITNPVVTFTIPSSVLLLYARVFFLLAVMLPRSRPWSLLPFFRLVSSMAPNLLYAEDETTSRRRLFNVCKEIGIGILRKL